MDVNDSKPTQGSPNMVANDWRTQKTSEIRRKIVSQMEKVIKQIFSTRSQSQIQNLALNLEEKMFAASISKEDYLQKVTIKLGSMKMPVPPTAAENPGDQVGSRGSEGQFRKPEQPFQNPLATQSLEHQQLSTQNCLNNTTPSSVPMNLPNNSNKQQQQNQILKQNVNSPASLQSSQQSIMHGSLAMPPSLTQMKASSVQLQDQQSLQQSTQSIDRNLSQSVLKLHQQSQPFPFVNTEKAPLEEPVLPLQKRSQLTGQLQGQEGRLNAQQSGVSEVQNQQKYMGKDYHSTTHLQQLRRQSNVSRLLGTQSGNSGMGSFQSTQMKQQADVSMQQQAPQATPDLLLTRGRKSQPEPHEHKVMSQARSLSANFLGHPHLMLEEMKQAVEVSDSLFEAQQLVIQRKQLLQSKSTLPAASANLKFESGQVDEDTWREEIYQWIQTLKKLFLPELKEQCYKVAASFRQIGTQPQNVGDREKCNKFYHYLMEFVKFLEVARHRIQPKHKQLIAKLEKELINLFKRKELKRSMSLQQHNQLPLPTVPPFQQSSHPQTQNPHHLDTNMLQSMQIKQQGSTKAQLREQQYPQGQVKQQLLKQKRQREMLNVQQPPELHAHQKSQGTHMNVTEVMNVKQEMGDMGTLIQHHFSSQQPFNIQEQVKLEPPSPVSSPQLLQGTSVQLPQNPSPKKKQKNLQTSPAKTGNLVTEVMNVKQEMGNMGTLMQHHFSSQQPFNIRQRVKLEPPSPVSSPQLFQGPSIQLPQNPSPKKKQMNLQTSAKTGNPTDIPQASGAGIAGTSLIVTTPGIAASPLIEASINIGDNPGNFAETGCHESSVIEQPLQRLLRVVNSMSTTLGASVETMVSVVGMVERMAGSVHGKASTAALGEDLAAMTRSHLQERNSTKDGLIAGTSDSVISELESSAAFPNKRTKIKANNSLMEEIRKINQRLINTVVEISDENANSTTASSFAEADQAKIVKCSFIAVSTTQNFESAHASENLLPIQPLKLLIPGNYPNHSPLVLDKLSALASADNEDLSVKAISRLNLSLRSFQQPFSLEQIAKAWDACAYCVVREYAEQHGGGNFSSRFGMWENCPCPS